MKERQKISYGLYIVTANDGKINGCVANTLVQHTTEPNQVTITLNKTNHTTSMIKDTKKFNVSMLDVSTKFDIIKRFGFASGKDTTKFDGFDGFVAFFFFIILKGYLINIVLFSTTLRRQAGASCLAGEGKGCCIE